MACPCDKSRALGYDPVKAAVEVQDTDASIRRRCGDEEVQWCSGGYFLVEEWYTCYQPAQGCEERECRNRGVRVTGDADEGAASGIQDLRGGEGDAQEGGG